MKKILSVLLAVCMLLSIAPMAFAEEATGEVNDVVVDEVIGEVKDEVTNGELELAPEETTPEDDTAVEEEMPVFSLTEAFAFVNACDFAGLVDYIGQFMSIETVTYAISNALGKLGGLGIDDFLDGELANSVVGSFTDICATIADVLVELLAMVGIDFDQIVEFINDSKFLSFIASFYAYGGQGTPSETTTIPEDTSEEVVTDPTTEPTTEDVPEAEPTTEPEVETEYVDYVPEDVEIPQTGVADMGIAAFAALSVAAAAAYVLTKKKA